MGTGTAECTLYSLANALLRLGFVVFFAASFLGCGGVVGQAPSQPPPPAISVAIAPASASVLLGMPQAFTATVANSTNTSVSWSVNGVPGGNAAIGTIDSNGAYSAPRDLPVPASVTVQATSAADSSKSASAAITVTSDISLSVSPQAMPVELGAARTFAATVNSAGNPDRAVTWILAGSGCTGRHAVPLTRREPTWPRKF